MSAIVFVTASQVKLINWMFSPVCYSCFRYAPTMTLVAVAGQRRCFLHGCLTRCFVGALFVFSIIKPDSHTNYEFDLTGTVRIYAQKNKRAYAYYFPLLWPTTGATKRLPTQESKAKRGCSFTRVKMWFGLICNKPTQKDFAKKIHF